MPEYKVDSVKSLKRAFDRSQKEDGVLVTFSVPEIDFTNEDSRSLKLDDDCRGIEVRGPVTLKGVRFSFDRVEAPIHLVNLRVRVTAKNLEKGDPMDALYAEKCDELYLTNCTFSDSSDEIISLNYCDKVEISGCIIADPLHIPTVDNKGEDFVHPEGGKGSHGYGLRSSAIKYLKITNTIFGNCSRRAPQCNNKKVREDTVYRFHVDNCVIYNYGEHGFTYNNKPKEEEDNAKYMVDFQHNLFVPGPRTNKEKGNDYEAKEFDCEQPEDGMKFELKNQETNRIKGYNEMLIRYRGNDFYIPSGEGPTRDWMYILEEAGCHPHDNQDQLLLASIKNAMVTTHKYDNLEPELVHLAWPASGWRN